MPRNQELSDYFKANNKLNEKAIIKREKAMPTIGECETDADNEWQMY